MLLKDDFHVESPFNSDSRNAAIVYFLRDDLLTETFWKVRGSMYGFL